MPPKKRSYKVVGTAPVELEGKTYHPDDEFDATPGEVAFFLQVGAVEEQKKKD